MTECKSCKKLMPDKRIGEDGLCWRCRKRFEDKLAIIKSILKRR